MRDRNDVVLVEWSSWAVIRVPGGNPPLVSSELPVQLRWPVSALCAMRGLSVCWGYATAVRCLILSTATSLEDRQLAILASVLTTEGVEVALSSDIGAGADLARADLSGFEAAVAVLPRGADGLPAYAAILLELGVVLGVGIPALLVLQRGEGLPSALKSVPRVETSLDDLPTLRLHATLFVRTLRETEPRSRNSRAVEAAPTLPASFDDLTGHQFENLVATIFNFSGAAVASQGGPGDMGVDLAVAFDSARPFVVVVQAKRIGRNKPPTHALERAAQLLAHHVSEQRADLGMLVTDAELPEPFRSSLPSTVVLLTVAELQEIQRRGQLEDLLRRARNRAVHGA